MTTAQLAQALGVSEGNLWYHFRTKRDLVVALFEQLEQRTDETLSKPPPPGATLVDFAGFTRQSLATNWEYRFLFRDRISFFREDAELLRRSRALVRRGQRGTEQLLTRMVEQGLLSVEPEALAPLALNVWMVTHYWVDLLQLGGEPESLPERHLRTGLEQVGALLRPHLSEAARREADALAASSRS